MQEASRLIMILIQDHQAGGRGEAAALGDVQAGVENNRADAVTFEIGAGELGFDEPVESTNFDEPAHQGNTSPAATSSGRGERPSIALRCGKRPKRSMTSRCFFA